MDKLPLKFEGTSDIQKFVYDINSCACEDDFSIESEDGKHRSSARSFLGVFYAFSEFPSMYLVNDTRKGVFPSVILQNYGV